MASGHHRSSRVWLTTRELVLMPAVGLSEALGRGTVELERSCTTCGAEMSPQGRFCAACGAPSKEGRQGSSTSAKRRLALLGIAALCVALAGGCGSASSDLATTPGTYTGYLEDEEGKRFAFTVQLPGSGQGQVGDVEIWAPTPTCTGTWRMNSASSEVWEFEHSACGATYPIRATATGGDNYDLSIPSDPRYHGEMELDEE